jgi:hypothetical protein
MKLDLDRITGLTGYFCLVGLYPVDPVDPVRKINRPFDKKAHDRQNTLLRHLSVGGGFIIRYSLFHGLCAFVSGG